MNFLKRLFAIWAYKQSTRHKKINYYFKRMRNRGLKDLSEEEYIRLDQLITEEREFKSSLRRKTA